MMFGIREVCDVVLRAKSKQTLGSRTFYKNEPVLYFDTLKTSTLEGAATTVYATGGKGNPRLIAWEGDRTLTFTFEDALISPEGIAILTGAGLITASAEKPIYVHTTSQVEVKTANTIEIEADVAWNGEGYTHYHAGADIFCMKLDEDGEVAGEPCIPVEVTYSAGKTTITCAEAKDVGSIILVDYYVKKTSNTQMIEIVADKFAGNYYLEGSCLFRREADGVDMPAELIIPNGKIQSNFTFTMANSGDPSTFTFTMDAFPDYTKFDRTKKVLAALQIIDDTVEAEEAHREPCVVGG